MAAGTYNWQVKARNAISVSAWSETWKLTIIAPPTLISPPNNASVFTGTTNFTWDAVASNAVSGAPEYYFEYADALSFNPPLGNSGWISATNYSANLSAGTYYWRVKARNALSASAWSAIWKLTVVGPPTLVSPPNDAIVFVGTTNFTWNAVSGATEYCFAYGNATCDTPSSASSGWIGATNYSTNLTGGTYNWHVKARNAISVSAWSAETRVLTVVNPPTPDGAQLPTGPIRFEWSPVPGNAASGTTEYYFEYAASRLFDAPLGNSGWISATNYSVNLNAGTYYWHIKARNAISESGWSASWTIYIQAVPDVWVYAGGAGFTATSYGDPAYWTPIPTPLIMPPADNPMFTWTKIDNTLPDNISATWRPTITTPGAYRVCIFSPLYAEIDAAGQAVKITNQAQYKIHHVNGDSASTQAQSNLRGAWMDLGRYQFSYGTDGNVYMGDYTGDPPSSSYVISADAAKFVWSPFGAETCQ
jgi:hypothetical protein